MDKYQQTCEYLFTQLPAFHKVGAGAYKPGLDTALTLSSAFGNPHRAFPAIHIAGTNGKGSTSHMLASILAEAGLKTGLYTSPHIFDFRERIRVDGRMIPEQDVVSFTDSYRSMTLGCEPSFFELATIMAFRHFADVNVDIAVIETGLGGRLDTTNIITPLLSVITNVSLDHTDLLGTTTPEIAAEKAGIIKPGVPVVVGRAEADVRPVFQAKADECHAPITFVEDLGWNPEQRGDGWSFPRHPGQVPELQCDLKGDFQRENIATVLTAIDVLRRLQPLDAVAAADMDLAVERGLKNVYANTGLMGRWTELRDSGPRVICDTGHNPGAWQWLAPMLATEAARTTLRVVMGFVSDKDVDSVFAMLLKGAVYYFVTPSAKRGRPASDLLVLAEANGLQGRAFDTVDAGLRQALADAEATDTLFIGGSNYVLGEVDLSILDHDSQKTRKHVNT